MKRTRKSPESRVIATQSPVIGKVPVLRESLQFFYVFVAFVVSFLCAPLVPSVVEAEKKSAKMSVISVISGEVFSAGFRREADLRAERRVTGAEVVLLENLHASGLERSDRYSGLLQQRWCMNFFL